MSEIIKSIEKAQLRTDRPDFNVGDTLRVFVKVVEGNRERLQAFEGTVIARRNGNLHGSPRQLRHRRRAHVPAAFSPR